MQGKIAAGFLLHITIVVYWLECKSSPCESSVTGESVYRQALSGGGSGQACRGNDRCNGTPGSYCPVLQRLPVGGLVEPELVLSSILFDPQTFQV